MRSRDKGNAASNWPHGLTNWKSLHPCLFEESKREINSFYLHTRSKTENPVYVNKKSSFLSMDRSSTSGVSIGPMGMQSGQSDAVFLLSFEFICTWSHI